MNSVGAWGEKAPRSSVKKHQPKEKEISYSEEDVEQRIQSMDMETFVRRVQHFARTVQQLKDATTKQRKESQSVILSRRSEATSDASELKKAIQYHNWGINNRVVGRDDRNKKIIDRTVREFQTTYQELKSVLEMARQQVKKSATPTSPAHSDFTSGHSDEENEIVQNDQEKIQEQKRKVISAKLVDWQQSTIDVENQIARESYETTKEMSGDYVQLQVLFKDFKSLVDENDAALDKIHTDVITARSNVERGVEEIKLASVERKKSPLAMLRLASFMPI
jgi:t-SNARE complex subunit (syntaxin)